MNIFVKVDFFDKLYPIAALVAKKKCFDSSYASLNSGVS